MSKQHSTMSMKQLDYLQKVTFQYEEDILDYSMIILMDILVFPYVFLKIRTCGSEIQQFKDLL